MSFISSSKFLLGSQPRDRNLSSFSAYLTSCPGRVMDRSTFSSIVLPYCSNILETVSIFFCSKPPQTLYISFVFPDSMIVITDAAVSSACHQFLIGSPLLWSGIFLPSSMYLQHLGISFSTYCPSP